MNVSSSRSHTIFQIEIKNEFFGLEGQGSSKLRIVDLAGSEKYQRPNSNQEFKIQELQSINKSISTLGQCISALTDSQRRHIPFR